MTAMPEPLPSAATKFHAGMMARHHLKYPHLPKSPVVHFPAVHLPSLSRTGMKPPATKRPMGMTLPIMTRHGVHPADTASSLPPTGSV
jgi:hypothetical protein